MASDLTKTDIIFENKNNYQVALAYLIEGDKYPMFDGVLPITESEDAVFLFNPGRELLDESKKRYKSIAVLEDYEVEDKDAKLDLVVSDEKWKVEDNIVYVLPKQFAKAFSIVKHMSTLSVAYKILCVLYPSILKSIPPSLEDTFTTEAGRDLVEGILLTYNNVESGITDLLSSYKSWELETYLQTKGELNRDFLAKTAKDVADARVRNNTYHIAFRLDGKVVRCMCVHAHEYVKETLRSLEHATGVINEKAKTVTELKEAAKNGIVDAEPISDENDKLVDADITYTSYKREGKFGYLLNCRAVREVDSLAILKKVVDEKSETLSKLDGDSSNAEVWAPCSKTRSLLSFL